MAQQEPKLSLSDTSWMKGQALYKQYFTRVNAAKKDGSTERDLQAKDAASLQISMWEAVCSVPSRLDASDKEQK